MKNYHILTACTMLSALTYSSAGNAVKDDSKDQSRCSNFEHCVVKNDIAVIGQSTASSEIIAIAQQGAQQFTRYFGEKHSPIAIVPGGTISAALNKKIEQEGFTRSLPWVSQSDQQTLVIASIRQQVREQTANMPEAQQKAVEEQAINNFLTNQGAVKENSDGSIDATQSGALTHELGHMWFIAAFQPKNQDEATGHGYGGWAPDWLDETAAVLLENETLTNRRRAALMDNSGDGLYPLTTFLTMQHPAFQSAKALQEKLGNTVAQGESRALVLSAEEAEEFLKTPDGINPAIFYVQVRGFIDYMFKKTNDERIFASIARHFAAGGDMETWLQNQPKLPQTVDALTADWKLWLKDKR